MFTTLSSHKHAIPKTSRHRKRNTILGGRKEVKWGYSVVGQMGKMISMARAVAIVERAISIIMLTVCVGIMLNR